jgi:hypothetical protein
MLSFGTVVACNNLLAMRSFNTFLSNYILFNKPSFIEKFLINRSKDWIYSKAIKEFIELKVEVKKETVNVTLNDCPAGLFAVLYLANQGVVVHNAQELFSLISATELDFVKLQKPKSQESYK